MSQAVEFDFVEKKSRALPASEVRTSVGDGKSCWLDLDLGDPAAEAVLRKLGIDDLAIEHALADEATSRLVTHDHCLHVSLIDVTVVGGTLRTARLELILAHELLVTLHRGPVEAIEQVRKTYSRDFEKFAKSLGFMLYEVFDHLADDFRRAIRAMEAEVERFQARIFGDVDDEIFNHVGRVNRDLLALRAALLAARDLLHQLATRRSPHVSETTQPALENIVGVLERLGEDLTVAREILAESLDLYMSTVSHRTNQVVTRLTILSVIFLPLTFLCGVYGMNFKYQPELQWEYGYPAFWIVVVTIAGGLLLFMKRRKWL